MHGVLATRTTGTTGAPRMALNVARCLASIGTLDVLVGMDGPMGSSFSEVATRVATMGDLRPIRRWQRRGPSPIRAAARLVENRKRDRALQQLKKPDYVWVNTIGFPEAVFARRFGGTPLVLHVHEMSSSFGPSTAGQFARADVIVAASEATKVAIAAVAPSALRKIRVLYEFIERPKVDRHEARRHLREQLGVQPDAVVVGAAGQLHWRKGPDLFIQTALHVQRTIPEAMFVWLGGAQSDPERRRLEQEAAQCGASALFMPEVPDAPSWSAGFDVFALTSREDPFPLVVLEAGASAVPSVCFAGAGGIPEIGSDSVTVVPYLDVPAFASAIVSLLENPALRDQMGLRMRDAVESRHLIETARQDVAEMVWQVMGSSASA